MGGIRASSAAVALIAAAAITHPAAAAATYVDSLTGVEVAASSSEGTFVGTATGQLPGAWQAVVDHGPLPKTVGGTAAITSGSFAVATVLAGHPAVVEGTLDQNGTGITMLSAGARCRKQRFSIVDGLSGVGAGGGSGTGTVSAVLTHYRTGIFGHCVTYAASVSGSISLTF